AVAAGDAVEAVSVAGDVEAVVGAAVTELIVVGAARRAGRIHVALVAVAAAGEGQKDEELVHGASAGRNLGARPCCRSFLPGELLAGRPESLLGGPVERARRRAARPAVDEVSAACAFYLGRRGEVDGRRCAGARRAKEGAQEGLRQLEPPRRLQPEAGG